MKKVRRFCRAFFSVLRGVESVLRACRGFREGCFLEKAPPRTPPQKLPNMEVLSRDSLRLSAKSRNSFLYFTYGVFLTRVPSRAEQTDGIGNQYTETKIDESLNLYDVQLSLITSLSTIADGLTCSRHYLRLHLLPMLLCDY